MQRLTTIGALIAAVLVSGCGRGPAPTTSNSPTSPTSPTTFFPDIAGNWQFAATPSAPGKLPFGIAGSISQTAAQATGAVHVLTSNCFDRLITRNLTGTVTSDTTTLTSTAADGQTISLSGHFVSTPFGVPAYLSTFTGTYSVSGGCDDGDQGAITGNSLFYIGNDVAGAFTNNAQKTFNVSASIAENAGADPTGSFAISGAATFDTPCFSTATVAPGQFPSGSYILGTNVGFEFDAGNSQVDVFGTLSQDGSQIIGTYTISGGACNGDAGTAALQVTSPWDY